MASTKTPGESAAISGYNFQYEIFATEIYNHLLNDDIEWVEFASTAAGKLDDVLIGLKQRVIAYQVKEIGSSRFSYNEFTASDTESIWEGAFKGWRKLRIDHPDTVIDARFITTQEVSENDSITAFAGTPKPSFSKFIRNLWKKVQGRIYDASGIPAAWKPVLEELAGMVGAGLPEVIDFIRDFSFVFEYKLNYYLYDTYTRSKRETHITAITKHIFRLVGTSGNVKYTRAQFLTEFGLKNNFETRFQHAFFVDEKHYQPIAKTIIALNKLVAEKEKGYIALVGNAGSGKSTLLTKWLSGGDYKVFKYYAYTNIEMGYNFGYRGEASIFLHDILIQIRESKLTGQDRLPENDMLDLQKHLNDELQKFSFLHEKVFILVDGLDHIDREQKVDRSLLEVLPLPAVVPTNVFFILGSRTIDKLEELPFDIRHDLNKTNSIVKINSLSKSDVLGLITSYGLHLPEGQFEDMFVNTNGHPLFLRYTLERLLNALRGDYMSIINDNKFEGDIEKEYQKFWDKYRNFDDFSHILGIISRFRFPYFDLDVLRTFRIKTADAGRVNAVAEFYFYKSGNIWQFFHNSFKEFLIRQTAADLYTGEFDPYIDKSLHVEIAEACKAIRNEYRFNELYHRYKAGQSEVVTALVSQEYFRKQWFAFRNNHVIFEDIRLVCQAAYVQKDLRALAICFFASFELDQRRNNFLPRDYYDLFLLVGWLDIASSFVFDSARLLTGHETALNFAKLLYQEGYTTLARGVP